MDTWTWTHGHGNMAIDRDIGMDTWTWTHGHGHMDMDTWTWTLTGTETWTQTWIQGQRHFKIIEIRKCLSKLNSVWTLQDAMLRTVEFAANTIVSAQNGTSAELGAGGGGEKLGQKRRFFLFSTCFHSYFITYEAAASCTNRRNRAQCPPKVRWVKSSAIRWVLAWDCGAEHRLFYLIVSLHLVLNIFPFPVSTTKLIGVLRNKRRSAANSFPGFAYSLVSQTLRQYYWRDSYSACRQRWRCQCAPLRL
jgi:hypothetical protein